MVRRLEEVFGIGELKPYSYVDRGRLDEQIAYLLRTDRHIAIHGDSKQGKSWLRERVLPESEVVRVQCTTASTAASVLEQALGLLGMRAEVRYTQEKSLTGTIDLGASGQLGAKVAAQATAQGKLAIQAGRKTTTESAAVGRTPADVPWIALVLATSKKRLVLEDFHYLALDEQRSFSFIVKALGEYAVPVMVVGVWAEDHLLSYHNGDLSGRVEDVRLGWTDGELRQVLAKGSTALNVELSAQLADGLVQDSFGNIGLLQRLTERLLMRAGATVRERRKRVLDDEALLGLARDEVVAQMAGRFLTFVSRMTNRRPTYGPVVEVVLAAADDQLLAGLPVAEIATLARLESGKRRYSTADLRHRLSTISEAQSEAKIFPPVLTFDAVGDRLFLVDRALLFYRKYATAPLRVDK